MRPPTPRFGHPQAAARSAHAVRTARPVPCAERWRCGGWGGADGPAFGSGGSGGWSQWERFGPSWTILDFKRFAFNCY